MARFIPAEGLKETCGVFGHFYSVELASKDVIECRSVLEIAEKSRSEAVGGGQQSHSCRSDT